MTNEPLKLFDKLLCEDEQIHYNIFYLIANGEDAFWASDEQSYIIGQSNANAPMWIWIKPDASEEVYARIKSIVSERLDLNPNLKLTADQTLIADVIDQLAREKNTSVTPEVPMIAYRCDKVVYPKVVSGRRILSDNSHKETLARFITGMIRDLADRDTYENEAEDFANDVAGSPDMFLWEDGGIVTSMAMIAHRAQKQARINTVFTDHACRGRGYAGALVGEVTQKLLDEGLVPMLYTETDNVCSNAVYRKIGYRSCGELTSYIFTS